MTRSRLMLALEQGLTTLPPGAVAFINAPGDVDLAGLDAGRIHASQSFYPDYSALAVRGIAVTPAPEGKVAASVVHCHRSKPATLGLIAQAVELTAPGGLIAIDGAKTDGVESVIKEVRRQFATESFSKAHGKLAWFERPAVLPDLSAWRAGPIELDGFTTLPGIFSADGPDAGSHFLTGHLPALQGRVADLGAGWGYLSHAVLQSDRVSELDLVEADFNALQAAKLNINDPRAAFHWMDVQTYDAQPYDAIISNPPFHVSRRADPALGQAFIRKAASLLRPKGLFWMVANRNLPYEQTLADSFQHVETVSQNGGFKVFCARKPKTSRPRR